ncbi:hypothetical protein C1I98_21200 [Spongiactinospora gelatinilytica]|uniref:DUF2637 domain-containing protein n=1 Tax=Spongiactinospora gelatinilytica TaxID=2666298 RepID=A0A2W2GN89_9ACTN|nr:DUF2637 domain-containing protein [Spongiactinospora gelatinilytica]PZG41515.1 hypothetical protein C1I98_21200 [Spongiactinospora gelatinilytica]
MGGVAVLAGIAAVVSFRHMHELCLRHGEDHLAAVLIPLAVDGTIVVASMSILLADRYGARGGPLAWNLLIVGSPASLGANVAVAEPSVIGRGIAAWPSAALIGSYELSMAQIRRVSPGEVGGEEVTETTSEEGAAPGEDNGEAGPSPVEAGGQADRGVVDLHRVAWRWAQENRLPDGALPSGRVIAAQFSRSARWGRWIKNAGLGGELG